MPERPLVGLAGIILVATTIATALVFEAGEEEAVRVIASQDPDVAGGGGPPSYSLDLMAVKDLPDLVITLHFLAKIAQPVLHKPWNETMGRDPEDLMENYPRLKTIETFLDGLAADLGQEPTYQLSEFSDAGLVVVDFTDTIAALAGEDRLTTLHTIYAFCLDEEGNVTVYEGYRDFFLGRDRAVSEIKCSTTSETRCYRSERAGSSAVTCLPIEEAPLGIIKLRDLSADEIVSLEVTLDALNMLGRRDVLRLIRVQTGHGSAPTLIDWIG